VKIAGTLTGKGGGANVYLNDTAYWRNIPANVWDYTIGGYQVIKKWLSYREHGLLGRALTADEAREVTHMARRIAAIVLLYPALDTNYLAIKQATLPWSSLLQNG
jgi:Type ISP C-terminal specificity domain